jgi:hypothetical protein
VIYDELEDAEILAMRSLDDLDPGEKMMLLDEAQWRTREGRAPLRLRLR